MSELGPRLEFVGRTRVRWGRRTLVYFGGCDYFRLSSHPEVRRALRTGLEAHGLNVAASRLTTGNHPLYEELERRLAQFFRREAAVVVSSGYVTNLVLAQALAGRFTHVLIDEAAHTCLDDAVPFFGGRVLRFHTRDPQHVTSLLRRIGRRARPVLLTDGMFAHDGSLAPVGQYLERLPPTAMLLLDDAHGAGTLGPTGKGTLECLGVTDARVVLTLTLSKAFGSYGGAILGRREVIDRVRAHSALFAGNTPLPLPLVCAALKSLQLLRADRGLRRRLEANTARVKAALQRAGLPVVDSPSPIVALTPRAGAEAARLQRALLAAGIYPSLIRYPGGPRQGYFRFALSSEHSTAELDRLCRVLVEHWPV
jgi:7-keto-8-aminopelargonate synthetase-like enzyme